MNRSRSTISANSGEIAVSEAIDRSSARVLTGRMRACENGPRFLKKPAHCRRAPRRTVESGADLRATRRTRPALVSHETIYSHIYADKRNGGTLHRALRCQKRAGSVTAVAKRRGTIPNQVSIEQRPAIVDTLKRFGDWEADLVWPHPPVLPEERCASRP